MANVLVQMPQGWSKLWIDATGAGTQYVEGVAIVGAGGGAAAASGSPTDNLASQAGMYVNDQLSLFAGKNWELWRSAQGKGLGTAAITAGGGTASVSLTLASAGGIVPGQQLLLTGSGTNEVVTVAASYVIGSTTVPLVTGIVTGTQTTAEWSKFIWNGPQNGGFSGDGLPIAMTAMWNAAQGAYYIPASGYGGSAPTTNNGFAIVQLAGYSSSGNAQVIGTGPGTGDNVAGGNTLAVAPYTVDGGANYRKFVNNNAAPTTNQRLAVAVGSGVITALSAVTANGNGTGVNLGTTHKDWSVQVNTTGSPTGYSVQAQWSLDGAAWTNLGAAVTNAAPGNISVTNVPAIWVRANLASLAGGTSPTVTCLIAAM